MVRDVITEYYENPAISQSQLKLLLGNPAVFNTIQEPEMYFEEKKHFIIGSGVDCLLTQSPQEFHQRYHVSEVPNKPSDAIKSIINMSFDIVKETHSEIGPIRNYPDTILRACNEHAYQSRWGDELRVNKICEYWEYWEDLKNSQGKQVLSSEEYLLIYQIAMSIKSHDIIGKYFIETPSVSILYQYPIYFEYKEVECKALLDMVVINHQDKTIQPIDIKTVGDYVINFPKSIRQRRYDIQAAFYTEALEYDIKINPNNLPYDWSNYKILPFKFIVQSSTMVGQPVIFTCDYSLLEIGKKGREELVLDSKDEYYTVAQEIKGFDDLIELYKYYTENGFEVDQIISENNNDILVDWSGIIV